MSELTYENIQRATTLLVQISLSRGPDADPVDTLARWRTKEGFEEGALERAARESAQDSIAEIEGVIEDGGSFTTEQLREYLEREFMAAAQIFWIARARHDAAQEKAASSAS